MTYDSLPICICRYFFAQPSYWLDWYPHWSKKLNNHQEMTGVGKNNGDKGVVERAALLREINVSQ